MHQPVRLAVLASGGGSNLQALIDHFHTGTAAAAGRVALVVASRAGVGAIDRADRAGIARRVLDRRLLGDAAFADALAGALAEHGIDMVVLAGWLQLVPDAVVAAYRGRMLNIHPALLPAFGGQGMYGMRVHRAVLAAGVRISGATVHWVDERYDEGAIIAQWPVPVLRGDTPESLAARVLRVEHRLLPAAIDALLRGDPPPPPREPVGFALTSETAPSADDVAALLAQPTH